MSNINYSGKVTIKKFRKQKLVDTQVLHNNGTQQLFNVLLRFLSGNLVGIDNQSYVTTISHVIPKFIDIVREQAGESILYSPLLPSVNFNNNSASYTLSFTVYVSPNDIDEQRNIATSENEELYFVLKNSYESLSTEIYKYKAAESGVLASVASGVKGSYNISSSELHEITWELSFHNEGE